MHAAEDVSVVICAYTEQRFDDLLAAVASVQRQRLAPREIIVVIDHNPRLFASVSRSLPEVTVVENSGRQGLASARNTGVAASRGASIAFLDDDAVAEPDWLSALTKACDESRVLGSGSRVAPAWQGRPPRWFPPEFYWVVGCSYRGLPTTRSPVRNPIGSSMCVRRKVFDAVGGFSSDVGRVGSHPTGCEETELCIRALQRWPDGRFLYEPATSVRHAVPPIRTTWSYFRSRCFFEGCSKAAVTRAVGSRGGLASERVYALQTLPLGIIQGIADTLFRRDISGMLRAGAIISGLAITTIGYLMERLSQLSGDVSRTVTTWQLPTARVPASTLRSRDGSYDSAISAGDRTSRWRCG